MNRHAELDTKQWIKSQYKGLGVRVYALYCEHYTVNQLIFVPTVYQNIHCKTNAMMENDFRITQLITEKAARPLENLAKA